MSPTCGDADSWSTSDSYVLANRLTDTQKSPFTAFDRFRGINTPTTADSKLTERHTVSFRQPCMPAGATNPANSESQGSEIEIMRRDISMKFE